MTPTATSADHPVLAKATREWEANAGEMMARALGDAAGRGDNLHVLATFIDPPGVGSLPLERNAPRTDRGDGRHHDPPPDRAVH